MKLFLVSIFKSLVIRPLSVKKLYALSILTLGLFSMTFVKQSDNDICPIFDAVINPTNPRSYFLEFVFF